MNYVLAGCAFAAVVAALAGVLFFKQPRFGRLSSGERLARLERSPNFAHGRFNNLVPKPMLAAGKTQARILWDFLFHKEDRAEPSGAVPSRYTNLNRLDPELNVLVWLGHASCFIQVDGKKLLVDPVLGPVASPVRFVGRAFANTCRYSVADLPEVDWVLITHDHWDHLEYETIVALGNTRARFICGLGVGEHLEYWGIAPERITEMDWQETAETGSGFTVHAVPTHHFSGRGLRSNTALWTAYVLESPSKRLYLGGDSGYEAHFAAAGARFGGFDLAVLENGQYNTDWPYHHMQPEQTLQAAVDLKTRALFPVHSGKFALARHAWDEPLRRLTALERPDSLRLLTPTIGEPIRLDDRTQTFARWWESTREREQTP